MITIKDYISASNKYPERQKSPELTDELKKNAEKLLAAVNAFLEEIGISEVSVSSGFRPSSVNAALPNSAKRSLHMTGSAIDLAATKELQKLVMDNVHLLPKYNLWLEDPESTPTWIHLDMGTRTPRTVNVFKV